MDSGFDCDSVIDWFERGMFCYTLSRLSVCTKYWHFLAWDFPPHARTGRSHAKKCTSLIEANQIYRAGDGIERFDNNPCEKMASRYGLALPSSKLVRPLSIYVPHITLERRDFAKLLRRAYLQFKQSWIIILTIVNPTCWKGALDQLGAWSCTNPKGIVKYT